MSDSAPAVSVLMSVKNGMPYVGETIDSIFAQTFTGWEFIINDNASTDGTGDYLRERAASDPRITLLPRDGDRGCAGGYNYALSVARAPWVAIIDADDRALPQRLERQLDFVSRYPQLKAASTLAYYIDSEGRRVAKTHHDLMTPADFERYMAANEAIGILNPGALVRREDMLAIGGYRQEFFPAEDIDLWARLSEKGLILVQPEYLMEYRVHAGSSITQGFTLARMKYEWSRACSAARRSNQPEPTWEAFLAEWNGKPLLSRLDRWRKLNAKRLYRQAAFDWISHRRPAAVLRAAYGSLLQPRYVVARLRQQTLRPFSKGGAA